MSKPTVALKIPPGYEKQYISTAPSRSGDGYIKQKVLEQWLKDNEQKVGSRWDFAICEGTIVLCVKIGGQLSNIDVADLQKKSHSKSVKQFFDDSD